MEGVNQERGGRFGEEKKVIVPPRGCCDFGRGTQRKWKEQVNKTRRVHRVKKKKKVENCQEGANPEPGHTAPTQQGGVGAGQRYRVNAKSRLLFSSRSGGPHGCLQVGDGRFPTKRVAA